MYSLRNLLDKEPVAIAGAVRLVLAAIAVAGFWTLKPELILAVVIALEAVLTLFVRAKSIPTAGLEELAGIRRVRPLRARRGDGGISDAAVIVVVVLVLGVVLIVTQGRW